MSLATRSPSPETETSVAMRWQEPGFRDLERLQNGVWSQFRNSSFFHEKMGEGKNRRVKKSGKRRVEIGFLLGFMIE